MRKYMPAPLRKNSPSRRTIGEGGARLRGRSPPFAQVLLDGLRKNRVCALQIDCKILPLSIAKYILFHWRNPEKIQ